MIHESNELNQIDLANGLYLSKGAITRAVKKLEDNGWIVREKSSVDKRSFVLKLSKQGEDFIPVMFEINEKWEDSMGLDKLDSNFLETFNMLALKSIDLNLEKNKKGGY